MAIALVTGTSSGIGLATAVALARAGHTVAATLRNLDGGAEIRRVAEEEKLPIHLVALDVDDDASVREAFDRVVAQLGPIDVLVNNAGVPGGGPVEETTLDQFRQVMETNFFGGLRCIKAVIPSMRERRKGTIVNITSIAGRLASAPMASYAASKWAFEALSECLAQEVRAFNVRVAIVGARSSSPRRSSPKRLHRQRTVSTRTGGGFAPCSPPRSPNPFHPPWSATSFGTLSTATSATSKRFPPFGFWKMS